MFGKLKSECNAINCRGIKKAIRKAPDSDYINEYVDSYFAGLLDSDGSFVIYGKNNMPKVNLSSNNLQVIHIFNELYGGSYYVRDRKNKGWNLSYQCDITAVASKVPLKRITPYLILKKKQAKLLWGIVNVRKYFQYNRDPIAKAKKNKICGILKEKCSSLNKKSVQNQQMMI